MARHPNRRCRDRADMDCDGGRLQCPACSPGLAGNPGESPGGTSTERVTAQGNGARPTLSAFEVPLSLGVTGTDGADPWGLHFSLTCGATGGKLTIEDESHSCI